MSVISQIGADPGKIRDARPKDYAIRFLFGGIITAVVGVVATAFGPAVAGLFLGFPAILPASLTLVSRDDGEKMAGADALGAALGSIGLLGFGAVVWFGASRAAAWQVLLAATVVWFVISATLWAGVTWSRNQRRAG